MHKNFDMNTNLCEDFSILNKYEPKLGIIDFNIKGRILMDLLFIWK